MPLRVLGAESKIIVGAASRPAVGIAHQRTAVRPAAKHLGGDPARGDSRVAGLACRLPGRGLAIVVEYVDVLLELAQDEEGAVAAEVARRRRQAGDLPVAAHRRQDAGPVLRAGRKATPDRTMFIAIAEFTGCKYASVRPARRARCRPKVRDAIDAEMLTARLRSRCRRAPPRSSATLHLRGFTASGNSRQLHPAPVVFFFTASTSVRMSGSRRSRR